jgi:ComF family protein
LDKVFSATSFENKIVQKAIHKLKYSYIKELSIPLAYLIIRHLQVIDCQISNDFLLVPIPLSNKEKRLRGFNQSEEIAKIISEATKIPLFDCVKKIKETKPQRKENIKDAFLITKDVSNKKIILVDDVYATDSTMEEVAKKLKESKASVVWGVTVAREIS